MKNNYYWINTNKAEKQVRGLKKIENNENGHISPKPRNKKFRIRQIVSAALLLVGIVLLLISIQSFRPPVPPQPESVESAPIQPIQPPASSEESSAASETIYDEDYLKDKLYITQERADYQSGQLVLKIPRMGVDTEIQAGVTNKYLDIGPGLFDYSQLPGEGKRNVSIGAHRDIKGAHFYFIHKLTKGDLFYLVYNNQIFVYEYKDTKIIKPDDWGPIYGQGFSCLTLISCTPIGTTRERIVVRAELKQEAPYTEDYAYKPWVDGMEKPYAWEASAKSWDDVQQNSIAETPQDSAPSSQTSSVVQ